MTPPPQATFVSSAVPMRKKRYSSGPASSTSILLLPLLPLLKLACCSSSDSSSVAAREHPFESEVLLALLQDLAAGNPSPGSSIRSDRSSSDTKNDSNTTALNSRTHNDSNSNQSHGSSFANGTSSSGSSGSSGVVSSLPVSFTSTDFAASSHVSVPTAAPHSAASDTSPDSSSSFSSPARSGPSWPPLSALPPSSPASVPSFSPPSPSALSSLGPRGPPLEHLPALPHEAPRPTAPHTADRSARGAAAAGSSAAFSVATSWPSPLFSSRVFSSPRPFSSAGADGAGGEDEAASTATVPTPAAGYAVLVVPGIAGSGLFARITEAKLPACAARAVTYDSFRIWAALSLVLPPLSHQKCWVDMMQQQVDEKGEVYQSKPGVELQVDDYGGIHAIDFLDYYMHDSYGIPGSAYMHGMLQTLQKLHYQPFTTLRGVPYDWRLPPWQFDFSRLKADIEERFEATEQQKVDLLAHSLGTVILCYFFNKVVDQAWKNKYIKTFTLVGAATGGSFKAIKCLLSGYDTAKDLNVWSVLDVNFFPTTLLRDLLRSMGSTYALLPDPQLYGSDRVVATVLHPRSATPSPSSPVLLPWTVAGSGGGREGASKFEGIEAEGGEIRGHGAGGEGAGGSRDGADDEAAFGLPSRELRRRRLLAKEEDELESATAGPSNGRPSHAEEKRRREKQQLQQQEQVRRAAEREYATRSRMSDEERQRLRNERTHAYVQEQQQRLQEVYEKVAKEDIPKDVYTLANWTSLLPPDLQQRAKVAREKMSGIFADPGVPVRCIWSTYDTPTTDVAYVYDTGNLDRMPIPVFGFGDDTVPVESLSLCTSWPSTVEKHELKNVDHMYIFADKSFNHLVASMYGLPPPHEEVAPVSPQPLPPAILVTS